MSVTKDGFYNIEGKMFEVVHGVEGDCLILGDEDGGTRISGPKPWGGGQVTKTFVTQEKYGPIERLEEENAKLQEERDEWHRVAVSKQDIIDHMRDARAENEKLRERLLESREANEHLYTELRRYKSIFRMKPRAMNALFDENSKLHKLVLCLLTCANDTGDCDRCPLNGGTGDWDSENFCDGLLDCLRELRFEVTQ